MSPAFREVKLITLKRKQMDPFGQQDKYGHWWFEIGDPTDLASESYGWYPMFDPSLYGTLSGVPGELNGQTSFNGTPTTDPDHGTQADEAFHPVVPITDTRTDAQIADCLRAFAQQYSGYWQWSLGAGQNCRTFQWEALKHCGLRERMPTLWPFIP